MKTIRILLILTMWLQFATAQKVDLSTQVKNTLGVGNGGLGVNTVPTDGQVPIFDLASGHYIPGDPIVSGPDTVGVAPTRNPVQIGCRFLTTPPTLTNNQVGAVQCDATQNLLTKIINSTLAVTQSGTWNVGTVTSITNTVNTSDTQAGTWTVQQGTPPWAVSQSGTWSINQAGTWTVGLSSGSNVIGHVIADTGSTTAVTGNVTVVQATGTNLHFVCDSGCGGAASFADSSAFTFASTAVNNMSAVVDDVATNTVAENSAGAVRMNGNRILYVDLSKTVANTNKLLVTPDSVALPANQSVNVSQINGITPLMGNGTTGTGSQRVTIASDNSAFTVNAAQSGTWNIGTLTSITNAVDVSDRTARLLGHVILDAGAAKAGVFTTDQTTHGTTDQVADDITKYGGVATSLGQKTASASIPVIQASDWVDNDVIGSTVALNALNATASVPLAGKAGAGFSLVAGTLIGTIVPELSYDGGATYPKATLFFDAGQNTTYPSVVFSSSNTAQALTILAGNGVTNARVRVSAFTSGTANGSLRATDSDAQLVVNTQIDGKKQTYHVSVSALACVASTTFPCITIYGSASKTLRILHMRVSGSAATAALQSYFVNKLSSVPTAGTSTSFTAVPLDSNDPASTATTLLKYTVAPTGGAVIVGTISSYRCLAGSATVADNCLVDFQYGNMPGAHAITLRGTTQGIGVYSTIASTVDFEAEYTEE